MFIVVDASIWVARLVSEDAFYEQVKEWISARLEEQDQFLAPALLLAEIGCAISQRTTAALGLNAIEVLQNLPGLQLIEKVAQSADGLSLIALELFLCQLMN